MGYAPRGGAAAIHARSRAGLNGVARRRFVASSTNQSDQWPPSSTVVGSAGAWTQPRKAAERNAILSRRRNRRSAHLNQARRFASAHAVPSTGVPRKCLEALKERHERGLLNSIEFLKHLLELAGDLVATEKETPPAEDEDRGKAALTELFQQVRNPKTPVVVERVVADIDDIVKKVRFPDWQHTSAGERLVQKELRRALLKYKLHTDQDLFDRAYGYIKQYY